MVSVIILLQAEAMVTPTVVDINVEMCGIHFYSACCGDQNQGKRRKVVLLMSYP